ncbi:hypothetical protein [Telmatospirillum siberiense]|uniref:Uncharacterized protein n=1 Tax=Telmatospirillum siberiense TaxID=382514 RepID=A0A2N3PR81_9PROT|nr:hypothetical protein [Telmatospirillum siberiense]PKU22892.1 hypothetical protein CWS72_19785 [Telmatospirillum siberiense]
MIHCSRNPLTRWLLAVALATAALGAGGVASAQEPRFDHRQEGPRHEPRPHHRPPPPRHYQPPPVIVAPPPRAYYAPPVVMSPPGINIIIPIR